MIVASLAGHPVDRSTATDAWMHSSTWNFSGRYASSKRHQYAIETTSIRHQNINTTSIRHQYA
eukprot:4434381-Amphidinium_carterae.1